VGQIRPFLSFTHGASHLTFSHKLVHINLFVMVLKGRLSSDDLAFKRVKGVIGSWPWSLLCPSTVAEVALATAHPIDKKKVKNYKVTAYFQEGKFLPCFTHLSVAFLCTAVNTAVASGLCPL
jgi:hypothetical protein